MLFSLFLMTGCENNDFLQSESTVNAKLNGTWKRYLSTDPKQSWEMSNGSLKITQYGGPEDTIKFVDYGHYTVLTKFSKIFVTFSDITNLNLEPGDLNTRWNISELTGGVLYLSTTSQSGSVIAREFVKQ